MQNLAFTHLNLFDGKIDSDLQEDTTILVVLEKRGEAAEGTGTLEVGKSADFIVMDENPLDDLMALENLRHVVMRGNLIEKPTYEKMAAIEANKDNRYFEKYIKNGLTL